MTPPWCRRYGEFVVLSHLDHINVCKPLDKDDPAYAKLAGFLKARGEEVKAEVRLLLRHLTRGFLSLSIAVGRSVYMLGEMGSWCGAGGWAACVVSL